MTDEKLMWDALNEARAKSDRKIDSEDFQHGWNAAHVLAHREEGEQLDRDQITRELLQYVEDWKLVKPNWTHADIENLLKCLVIDERMMSRIPDFAHREEGADPEPSPTAFSTHKPHHSAALRHPGCLACAKQEGYEIGWKAALATRNSSK